MTLALKLRKKSTTEELWPNLIIYDASNFHFILFKTSLNIWLFGKGFKILKVSAWYILNSRLCTKITVLGIFGEKFINRFGDITF